MNHFTTPRLTAEKLHARHLDDLVALHLDPEVSRYLGGVRSAEVTKAYLDSNIAHWDRHGYGLWIVRTGDGEFAGRAGIRHILVEGVAEIEIAYAFKRTAWGQGFASEITAALIDIGQRELRVPSLVGVVYVDNVASRRVMEKSGFAHEREADFRGNRCVIYRLPGAPQSRDGALR